MAAQGAYLTQPADAASPMRSHLPLVPTTRYEITGGRPVGASIEPADTSGQAALQSAGFTALLAATGIAVGAALGGGFGAGAGLMLTGALANGYRAQKWIDSADPALRHEAVVSATFGVFQTAIGGYLVWRSTKSKGG